MFYIYYSVYFKKIKSFLQKIEKMFDFCSGGVCAIKIPCQTVRSGRG